jgi:hypothetical protein
MIDLLKVHRRPPCDPEAAPDGAPGPGCGGAADVEADRRLEEYIARALVATGHLSLRKVAVTARARAVTLRGSVATFYLKAIAQTVVLAAPGVRGVRNDLAVSPASPKAPPLLVKGAQ